MNKICKHCSTQFEITQEDLDFYEKISPVFKVPLNKGELKGIWNPQTQNPPTPLAKGGLVEKKYQIPSPTFCPDCRQQRRLSFRNERKLYRRRCDATGKNIISIYSPDKPYKVYSQKEWWSDKWNPIDYGRYFDFNRGFFEQFEELMLEVPNVPFINTCSENCDYANYVDNSKNCYLSQRLGNSENVFYSYLVVDSSNIIDSYNVSKSENCYGVIDGENCFNVIWSQNVSNCSNSGYLFNCNNCSNCFFSTNLVNNEYFFFNERYSKDEYKAKVDDFLKSNHNVKTSLINQYNDLKLDSIAPNIYSNQSENITGNYIFKSKNIKNSFDVKYSENISYSTGPIYGVNLTDTDFGYHWENCYDSCAGVYSSNLLFCYQVWSNSSNLIYCNSCSDNTNNCFGCIGLRNKSYCILNKQYTKEQYEELVPKIIEHMMKTPYVISAKAEIFRDTTNTLERFPPTREGQENNFISEWGEFFPSSLSPFGYNETVAQEYFPLTKEEAIKKGFKWKDEEDEIPQVTKIIPAEKLPDDITKIPDDILNWAIKCEITQRPFRLIPHELAFYRKHNLPVPHLHPDERHRQRMLLRNPRKLYDRKCDKCGKDIKTTYGLERKEIVYCDECYNREIY